MAPVLEDEIGALDEKHRQFVAVCELCAPQDHMALIDHNAHRGAKIEFSPDADRGQAERTEKRRRSVPGRPAMPENSIDGFCKSLYLQTFRGH